MFDTEKSIFDIVKNRKWTIAIAIVCFILLTSTMGVNNSGHRTVIQYLTGTMKVKFTPGVYFSWGGKTTEYNDVITMDFDKTDAEGEAATLDQKGIAVRYQDGGTGTVFGKSRFSLPNDEPTMLKLHAEFRSNAGVANKLIKSITEEAENLTAGLLSSEEGYTNRGIFNEWSETQIKKGKFQTVLKEIVEVDAVTGKKVTKKVPTPKIDEETGQYVHNESDLKKYGITVSGYQLVDWDFEPKTLQQIAKKREATMGVITAKANAELAKQNTITAEEQGKAKVMTAKYEKEVEKERAVVDAQKRVAIAAQAKLEARERKLEMAEYKQAETLRGEGDAAYKKKVMLADGALTQKLETYEKVMARFAMEFGKQKWVPEVMMGGTAGKGGTNEAANLINILTAKTLKDLGLDMSVKKN